MSLKCWERCWVKLPSRGLIKVYVLMFFCFFSNCFSVTMMFPFLPFMVEFLLPWLTESEELTATYVGILVSMPYFGRTISSYIWGVVADHWGRKPVIIISLSLIGLSTVVFGFSVSFEMALILRLVTGLSSGVQGACKAVVSEVSDDSTQAFGVTMLGTSWGLAIIVGPAIGGIISDPIGQYNLTIEHTTTREFLTRFPYSPPCLLSALLCAVSVLVTLFMLPETLGMKKKKSENALLNSQLTSTDIKSEADAVTESDSHNTGMLNESECDPTGLQSDCQQVSGSKSSTVVEEDNDSVVAIESETTQLLTDEEESTYDQGNEVSQQNQTTHRLDIRKLVLKALFSLRTSLKNLLTLLKDKAVLLSVMMFSLYTAIDIGFNDIYSVWAKTSPHLGGLGLSLNVIGITLTVSSALLLPIGLVIFPLLERKLGLLRLFYTQSIIVIPTIILIPNIHYLYSIKWLLWILVCTLLLTIQVCFSIGFNCQVLFINNSVTFDKLGVVNGIGNALSSLTKAVTSLVSGRIFSLSLLATAAGLGYPLDYRILFLAFGTVIYVCVLFTACLPVNINKQKIVEDMPREQL